jgi:hypothetical protein
MDIQPYRNRLQVIRVATITNPAKVIDLVSSRDRSTKLLVNEAVNGNMLTRPPYQSISVRVLGSLPPPTSGIFPINPGEHLFYRVPWISHRLCPADTIQ